MKIFRSLMLLTLFFMVLSCTGTKVRDVKSPCVSGEDGPCGTRKPINSWLQNYSA